MSEATCEPKHATGGRAGSRFAARGYWLTLVGVVVCGAALAGCTPAHYRQRADRETYGILASKTTDARWSLPRARLEPAPASRFADPYSPDRPPMPPDDPVAHVDMHWPGGMRGSRHWHDRGDAPTIENPEWAAYLPYDEQGNVRLTRELAVEVGLVNSREYQFELEKLYLAALVLSLERFEFQLHWFGGNTTSFLHSWSVPPPLESTLVESNRLSTLSRLGFERNLAAGGQFIADLSNSFVWEFSGAGSQAVRSNLALAFVQPLLRGAGRAVRLEVLTQAERSVLYAARDFARFRKQFYFDVVSQEGGYLSLLLQLQTIRNLESNLAALEQDLRSHEALADAGLVSRIQVDQVFQSYQLGRLSLIQSRNDYQTTLDDFKLRLGLSPDLPVEIDDSLLAPFELADPAVSELERELDRFLIGFRELDEAPDIGRLSQGFAELREFHERVRTRHEAVNKDMQRWREAIAEDVTGRDQEWRDFATGVQKLTAERLDELLGELDQLRRRLEREAQELDETRREAGWEKLKELTQQHLLVVAQLYVNQSRIRVNLISLRPVQIESADAVQLAHLQRLDLMNEQARVVDAWRRTWRAANRLQGDLDIALGADIGTEPGDLNPLDFSNKGTSYRAGVNFDGPLNRLAERNLYRAQLIEYQRARRSYMQLADQITRDVRLDIRYLTADRINFEISRQSLVVAARQVEMARDQLLLPAVAGESSTTLYALDALRALLLAKNSLINIWVGYETTRLRLLLDVEALQPDPSREPDDESLSPRREQPAYEPLPLPPANAASPVP